MLKKAMISLYYIFMAKLPILAELSVMFHQVHGTKEFAASFSKQRKSGNLARI